MIARPSKDEIAREILAYLSDHPDAQDTLDGIVQWWLLERKIKQSQKLVKEVLSSLVKKNLLEIIVKDQKTYYRPHKKHKSSRI